MGILKIVLFVLGLIVIALSAVSLKRKGEAELSKDLYRNPGIIIGAVIVIISLILEVVGV